MVMHTKDTVSPGFTTMGSSTSSLMDGEAVEEESDWQKIDDFDSCDSYRITLCFSGLFPSLLYIYFKKHL